MTMTHDTADDESTDDPFDEWRRFFRRDDRPDPTAQRQTESSTER